MCGAVIRTSLFEALTITVIVLNSIVLALEDPTATEQAYFFILIDYVFLALYTVEMLLKVFGQGFLMNRGAYLRDSWNVLDFVIIGKQRMLIEQ